MVLLVQFEPVSKLSFNPFAGRQLMPLGLCSRALLFDDVAEIEVTVVLEMVMDRVMDRGEFMQGLDVPEIRHRPLL